MSLLDPVAITALLVSLVALFTTSGQLLQQYLATADGYRRCQRSVMGDWATLTRLRWRWREFRFETLYMTPEIYLARLGSSMDEVRAHVLLLGDNESRSRSHTPSHGASFSWRTVSFATVSPQGMDEVADELVNWLSLLHWTHLATRVSLMSSELPVNQVLDSSVPTPRNYLAGKRIPAVRLRLRSWDFQPPDTVRPLAKTDISTIAIIARRLGMRWKSFRPEEGQLQAEAFSHILTSTSIRGLGLVLQYVYTGRQSHFQAHSSSRRHYKLKALGDSLEEAYVLSTFADGFGYGIVHGDPVLGLMDLHIDSQQDIITSLNKFDSGILYRGDLRAIFKKDPSYKFPVGNLVALTSPLLVDVDGGSQLCQVPAPSDNTEGMLTSINGAKTLITTLITFVNNHQDLIAEAEESGLPGVGWFNRALHASRGFVGERAKILSSGDFTTLPLMLIRWAVKMHAECNTQFVQLAGSLKYETLLQIHLRHEISRLRDFLDGKPDERIIAEFLSGRSIADLQHNQHLDNFLDAVFKHVTRATSSKPSKSVVTTAWILLMIRGLTWGLCHNFTQGERVPARYYGSQMPVWLS